MNPRSLSTIGVVAQPARETAGGMTMRGVGLSRFWWWRSLNDNRGIAPGGCAARFPTLPDPMPSA